ncbi:SAP domain-containing ribonucleoprotein-like [Bactrocera oleae]|uniref:SAP domain-containing ribonucleoprotein-like n=1 Tax=Bactrocera oleae TaxID=104688 RepID=UPI00387E4657
MAKFNDLKIPQLKKELEQRGLATNRLKTELQSRLRQTMEEVNINDGEYVFHMELEEETTKIAEKEEAQCLSKMVDIKMIFAVMSQMLTQISTEVPTQISTQMSQLETRLSMQLEVQFAAQDARISAQVSVALKGYATEILQTIPICEASSFETLMAALDRRYGSDHRKQIFQMEL